MKKAGFDAIARALHDAQVPFLVVGGIAVIHHGYGNELNLLHGNRSSYDRPT